ncbi:MAG: hypothetical protein QXH42_02185 [Thermoplasmata archaeon]
MLGRPVRDAEGRMIGVIKGLHQRFCPGGFEEVSIVNCNGVIIARVEELVPMGQEFLLVENKERREEGQKSSGNG